LRVAVKIGGFVFSSGLRAETITPYAKVLARLHGEGHRLLVVAGGGEEARKYIRVARELGASEYTCDILGISASRMNSLLLIAALKDLAYPVPPETIDEAQQAFQLNKIIVMAGIQPGQSTNAVAALCAEALGADILVNATNVDGVYTADPLKDPEAKRFEEIDTRSLLSLVIKDAMGAGSYELFDPVAIKIVERSRIPTRIVDGRIPENIVKAVRGDPVGTLVRARREAGTG
jgi:uridylate kinase